MFRIAVTCFLLSCYPGLALPSEELGSTPSVSRQGAYTPDRSSPERKAILDTLRVPVEKQLKQSVVFKIDHFKVQRGWAFLTGVPRKTNGSPINYRGTIYQEAVDAGAFDDGIVALLRNVKGKWRVIQFVIGATDVPYVEWETEYKAPKAIFDM